jgi:hypothetical protein
MTTFKAHFDGKTFVPDEPVNLPIDQPLTLHVDTTQPTHPIVRPEDSITGVELAQSGFAGLWADRTDIGDSVEFARKLRRQAETRGRSDL